MEQLLASLPQSVPPALKADLAPILDHGLAFVSTRREAYRLAINDGPEAAHQNSMRPAFKEARDSLVPAMARLRQASLDAIAAGRSQLAGTFILALWIIAGASILGIVGALAGNAVLVRRAVVRPIRQMTAAMGRLASGDLGVAIPCTGRGDEIGQMAAAVAVFKEAAAANQAMQEAQSAERKAKDGRTATIERLVRDFDGRIGSALSVVSTSAAELDRTAQGMAALAEQTREQAESSLASSATTARNVHGVAAAAEEMSATLQEISQQVQRSVRIVDLTAAEAGQHGVVGERAVGFRFADRRDRGDDHRHRLPDEAAGAECRNRGGQVGSRWQGVRGRGKRGEGARREHGPCSQGRR